jgi:acetyl esterase/lipase
MVGALLRVPARRPLRGPSSTAANIAHAVTREVVRSFMGYTSSLPLPEFRSIELVIDDLCKLVMPPVVRVLDVNQRPLELGGVPGTIYEPRDIAPQGVILYLHGGGYIGTSPTMYAYFTALLCRETHCAVFVADYRLAPEFPFPAGVEDAGHVLAALSERGAPTERLFVAGDSGGGGLAVSLMLAAIERDDLVRPAGLILFSPEVDMTLDEPSITENAEHDILPWNIPTAAYLHGVSARSPWVSPIHADLREFPPTVVSWGSSEMFRDPIRSFVARLEKEGVATYAHEAPDMFHVFPILMPWAAESRGVYRTVAQFTHGVIDDAPALPTNATTA